MGFFQCRFPSRWSSRELGRGACPQLLAYVHGGPWWFTCDTGYPSLAVFTATARSCEACD
jgi:hypothetical protein